MIDEHWPIDTLLCYREAKKKAGKREREREKRGGEKSRELISGCIGALLLLWFADKLRGLNTAVRERGWDTVAGKGDRGKRNKKIGLHRNLQRCKWSILDVRAVGRIRRVNSKNGIYGTADFGARPMPLFSPLVILSI